MNPTVIPASPGDPFDLERQSDITISSSPCSETSSEDVPTLVVRVRPKLDDDELDPTHADEQPPRSPGRVRFRSRVRIASGLHGHRHNARAQDRPAYSASSSASDSRSSSLSAPLRSEENWSKHPGWGTLGQRVAIMAQSHAQRRQQRALREQELFAKSVQLGIHSECAADERTPLTKTASYLYMTPDNPNDSGPTVDPADRLARDIDLVFGPWPTRLWNHHVSLYEC